MARKKARKKRAPAAKRLPRIDLPKGFEPISGFAPSWDFIKQRVLTGKIVSFGEVESQFKKGEMQRNCVIEEKDGTQLTVWESATLRGLFEECEEGELVWIVYQGTQKNKDAKKQPTKIFDLAYK